MEKERTYAVKVDGHPVPTWDCVWEQMMAQSCRIDRSNTIAWAALGVGVVNLVLLLFILL